MMNIPMPSNDEKRRSIETILQTIPDAPVSFLQALHETVRRLGWRGLFFGVGDAAFIALISIVIMAALFIGWSETIETGEIAIGHLHSGLFIFSPFIYILLYSLTMWKEHISGVLEIKQTCRITLRHLTALRMLCFGGAGMLFCAVLSGVLCYLSGIAFIRLFGVSLSSLFLFAAVFLFLIPKVKEKPAQIICTGLWCLLGVIHGLGYMSRLRLLLLDLPVFVFYAASILMLTVYVLQISTFFTKKGENNYAFG